MWTVLNQGYTESPTYFSQILKADLEDLIFPQGSTPIQYVDDLLLCSDTPTSSHEDKSIFTQTATKGHKVSKDKLQLCLLQVKYLGAYYLSQRTEY